ncbi:MAG: hypothetical protein LBN20_04675, partial [Endomicrobium sp.]|nr:hypothetical protein [Endomicrobium sp.]
MKTKINKIIKTISKLVGADPCVCPSFVGANNHLPYFHSLHLKGGGLGRGSTQSGLCLSPSSPSLSKINPFSMFKHKMLSKIKAKMLLTSCLFLLSLLFISISYAAVTITSHQNYSGTQNWGNDPNVSFLNISYSAPGAAITITANGTQLNFNNYVSFINNRANGSSSGGGAIKIDQGFTATLSANTALFERNYAGRTGSGGGGAIEASEGGRLTLNVTSITFDRNQTQQDGGQIVAWDQGAIIFNSRYIYIRGAISNWGGATYVGGHTNNASSTGGIYFNLLNGGEIIVSNNSARYAGGFMRSYSNGSKFNVVGNGAATSVLRVNDNRALGT